MIYFYPKDTVLTENNLGQKIEQWLEAYIAPAEVQGLIPITNIPHTDSTHIAVPREVHGLHRGAD